MHPPGSDAEHRHRVLKRTMWVYTALACWPFLAPLGLLARGERIDYLTLYLVFLSSVVASTAVIAGRRITRRSRGMVVLGWLGLIFWALAGLIGFAPDCS